MTVKISYFNVVGRRGFELELDDESLPAVLTEPDGTQHFFTKDGDVVRMEKAPTKRRRAAAGRRD